MDAITTDFWEVLLWSFWLFVWIAALMVWFRCLFDMFADRTLSGWGKAGWACLMIFVPWLGTIIYLIARGRSMTERQLEAVAQQQAAQEKLHPAGRQHACGPGRADHQGQDAARLRSNRPGRVQQSQGQGTRLTKATPGRRDGLERAAPARLGRAGVPSVCSLAGRRRKPSDAASLQVRGLSRRCVRGGT